MGSLFADNFTEMGTPLLTEQLGEVVSWRQPAAGGDLVFISLTAMVGTEGANDREEADGGRSFERVRTVTVNRADLTPQPNDQVTIGGVIYEVRAVINQSDSLSTVEVVRMPLLDATRPGYRTRD